MANALARGMVVAGLTQGRQVVASDPSAAARKGFAEAVKGRGVGSNLEVLKAAQVVFLAVKPHLVTSVLEEVRPHFGKSHLLISIAAGVSVATLEAGLNPGARVIRVMPNTPALVGASASAFSLGSSATRRDGELVQKLFSAVGLAFQVEEKLLDAVTGLSGSGPAYIYMVIEALSDGGVAAGLPREMATQLAAQPVLGSAQMVLQPGLHPGALKDMVTSPGGTTIEGVHELERSGVRAAFMNAVRAAARKARRLGRPARGEVKISE